MKKQKRKNALNKIIKKTKSTKIYGFIKNKLGFILNAKIIRFYSVGITGGLINLAITGLLHLLIFKADLFYVASIIGTGINLLYNFIFHTIYTFKTKTKHHIRFPIFIVYSIIFASIQETIIKITISEIGTQYLLFFKTGVIVAFSIITFISFNYVIFKDYIKPTENKSKSRRNHRNV